MLRSALTFLALSSAATPISAFQPNPLVAKTARPQHQQLSLFSKDNEDGVKQQKNGFASLALAGTIFASTLTASFGTPPAANADVELSTGAVIIQTNTKEGQNLLKAEVDVKDFVGTIIKNRKALKESVGRVAAVVKEEFASPVWSEVTKEILQLEGDVTPELNVLPPRDIQQTFRDLTKGKLNLIVNGEVINLSIEKSSTAGEDDIVIRAKGVKGVGLPSFNEPAVSVVRTRLEDQIDTFNEFWYAPIPIPAALKEKLADGTELTVGNAILAGGVLTVGGSYGLAYAYYVSEQDAAAAKAEAQRKVVADRKKKSADILKKKKAEAAANEEESEE